LKSRIFGQSSEAGMVTFPVLMLCASMLVCVTTILSVLLIRMQIESNRGMHQIVFEAVKSVALANMHELSGAVRPVEKAISVGTVSVNTRISGTDVVTVQVTGVDSGAEDTVRFTYDTIRKKVTDWKENMPPQ
jgi:hypothetical protein